MPFSACIKKLCIAGMLSLAACTQQSSPPTTFRPLPASTSETSITLSSGKLAHQRNEYLLIQSPPRDRAAFLQLVQEYESKQVDARKIAAQDILVRHFYRVSKSLPLDYQENRAYFAIDRIEHHEQDVLLHVYYYRDGTPPEYEFASRAAAYAELFGNTR